MKWTYTYQDHDNALIALRRISEDLGWRACCRVSSDDIAGVIDELEQFDFSGMEYVPHGFTDFLLWLCSLVSLVTDYGTLSLKFRSGESQWVTNLLYRDTKYRDRPDPCLDSHL